MNYSVNSKYIFKTVEGNEYEGILSQRICGENALCQSVFDLVDSSKLKISDSDIVQISLVQPIYSVQSYLVKFDMGNPVDVNINVYHQDQTVLTRKEIIEEALGYAEEIGFDITEQDIFEIETLEKTTKNNANSYTVQTEWIMRADVTVEAETLEKAKEKVLSGCVPEGGEFAKGSLEIIDVEEE